MDVERADIPTDLGVRGQPHYLEVGEAGKEDKCSCEVDSVARVGAWEECM